MKITKIPKGSKVQGGSVAGDTLEDRWERRWLDYFNRTLCPPFSSFDDPPSVANRLHACPARQYKILKDRKLSWDFAWPECKVCVEIQGGQFMAKSGHTNIASQNRDAEKLRLASAAGWRQLNFTSDDVKHERGFEELAKALGLIA
jgi:hypothetical protein